MLKRSRSPSIQMNSSLPLTSRLRLDTDTDTDYICNISHLTKGDLVNLQICPKMYDRCQIKINLLMDNIHIVFIFGILYNMPSGFGFVNGKIICYFDDNITCIYEDIGFKVINWYGSITDNGKNFSKLGYNSEEYF